MKKNLFFKYLNIYIYLQYMQRKSNRLTCMTTALEVS